jgi:hypothetical protein
MGYEGKNKKIFLGVTVWLKHHMLHSPPLVRQPPAAGFELTSRKDP